MNIKITVRNKLPICGDVAIVCNNSDYTVIWELDEEWSGYDTKTMRTVYKDGTYTDTVFTGNTVALPVVTVPGTVKIGLYAGDIRTSRAALIRAFPSITSDGGAPAAPSEDVYNQLMERMAQLETPDWAQNDPDAKDYIKNRTHYEESGTVVVAHVGSDAEWRRAWYGGSKYCHDIRILNVTLTLGETYHINIGGKTYTLECTECFISQDGRNVLGFNLPKSVYTLPFDAKLTEDLPFCMYVYENYNNFYIDLLMDYIPDPVDVTITKDALVTHPLDEKYLPVSARRFVVTLTQDDEWNLSADKTYAEIREAYESGEYLFQNICVVIDGFIYSLYSIPPKGDTGNGQIIFVDTWSNYVDPGILLDKGADLLVVSSDDSWCFGGEIYSYELCNPVSPDYGVPEDAIPVYNSSEGYWETAPARAFANVQSDLNQNDETQPDYVKNRPCVVGEDGALAWNVPPVSDATILDALKEIDALPVVTDGGKILTANHKILLW